MRERERERECERVVEVSFLGADLELSLVQRNSQFDVARSELRKTAWLRHRRVNDTTIRGSLISDGDRMTECISRAAKGSGRMWVTRRNLNISY